MVKKEKRRQMLVALLFFLVTVLRFFYAQCVVACYTPNAPHDETMQFLKSVSFANGEWMGEYSNLTLIKGCFYPIFAGTSFALSLNYIYVLQCFYTLACLFCTISFFPILKSWKTALVVYCLLLFNPISTSNISALTYRASLYYILVLVFLSGLCGTALRYSDKGRKREWFLLVGAVFYGLAVNTREDSQWLTLFLSMFLVVYVTFSLISFGRECIKRLATSLLLLLLLAAAPSLCIAWKNYSVYGVFLAEDYSSGSFAEAYAALQRPFSDSVDRAHYPVPEDVRLRAYNVSESFALLRPYLEGDGGATVWKQFASGEDYPNGWVTYALRDAAAMAGFYETAQTAQVFWKSVALEMNEACDKGLVLANKKSSLSIAAPFRDANLPEVLRRTFNAMKIAAQFEYVTPLLEYIELDKAYIDNIEQIIGCKINASYRNEHDLLMSGVDLNSAGYRLIVVINSIYKMMSFFVFLLSSVVFLLGVAKSLIDGGGKNMENLAQFIVVVGIFLLLLTRCFMMAYMDVTAYNTLTRPLYMSDSYVVAQLFSLIAGAYGGPLLLQSKKQSRDDRF